MKIVVEMGDNGLNITYGVTVGGTPKNAKITEGDNAKTIYQSMVGKKTRIPQDAEVRYFEFQIRGTNQYGLLALDQKKGVIYYYFSQNESRVKIISDYTENELALLLIRFCSPNQITKSRFDGIQLFEKL